MSKTLAVVQASRGAGPADPRLFRKLAGQSLFEWLIRRTTDCLRVDGVMVVLGRHQENELLRNLIPADVPIYAGVERDSLGQVCGAARRFQATSIVRVCADNPYADPSLIDRLVSSAAQHPECDYVGYCTDNGSPAILSPVGVFAEWCSTTALEQADQEAHLTSDREDATRYLYGHPEKFHVRLLPAPPELTRSDVRLKVDFEEDWEHAQVIFETLGPDEFDWQQIAGLLDTQPAIRKQMLALNQG
jgi:spore coat polysaccharide biosynthesis protein SpsF